MSSLALKHELEEAQDMRGGRGSRKALYHESVQHKQVEDLVSSPLTPGSGSPSGPRAIVR